MVRFLVGDEDVFGDDVVTAQDDLLARLDDVYPDVVTQFEAAFPDAQPQYHRP
ncbi:hypothetical protein ACFQH6_15565 [Halobacteriaceae archaeon GCM10025711]